MWPCVHVGSSNKLQNQRDQKALHILRSHPSVRLFLHDLFYYPHLNTCLLQEKLRKNKCGLIINQKSVDLDLTTVEFVLCLKTVTTVCILSVYEKKPQSFVWSYLELYCGGLWNRRDISYGKVCTLKPIMFKLHPEVKTKLR